MTYVLFECACGMWGKWQDQRGHSADCGQSSRLVYAEVTKANPWPETTESGSRAVIGSGQK